YAKATAVASQPGGRVRILHAKKKEFRREIAQIELQHRDKPGRETPVGAKTLLVCVLLLPASAALLADKPSKSSKSAAATARFDLCGDPLPPGASARLGKAPLLHRDFIRHLTYSDDGKLLASSSWKHIQVGSRNMTFKEITALAFARDKQ